MFTFAKEKNLPEIIQSYYPNAFTMESTPHNMEVVARKLREKYGNDWRCSANVVRDRMGRIKCLHIVMLGINRDFESLFYAPDVTIGDLEKGCDGLVEQFAYAG